MNKSWVLFGEDMPFVAPDCSVTQYERNVEGTRPNGAVLDIMRVLEAATRRDGSSMSILCWHAVDPAWESRLSVPPALFERQCAWLARRRNVLALARAAPTARPSGALPRGTAAVTFDDGLSSLYEHAWPVLERHGIAATIFLVAQTLTPHGKRVDWVDNAPPGGLATLDVDQVLEMQDAGVEFGSHSFAHRDLTELSDDECRRDLLESREVLEDVLGRAVPLLAYPRGLHDARVHVAAQRAGFDFAFGTSKPPPTRGPLAIPRIGVYPTNPPWSLRIKSSSLYPPLRTSRRLAALRGGLDRAMRRTR